MKIQKNAIAFRISREMAIDHGLVEPTPEERADRERRAAEYRQRSRDDRWSYKVAIETMQALSNPLVKPLLKLHAPDLNARFMVTCPGCDSAGCESEPPEWPCHTVRLIAAEHGIQLPDGDMPGAEHEADE